jgi:hypothetical protein
VKGRTLYSVCGLALLIFGCPKRQTTPRIVYVPQTPAATAQSAPAGGALVIQEPAPPAPPPVIVVEEPVPEQKPVRRRRRPPAGAEQSASEPAEEVAPPAEVPTLEPRESAEEQSAQRQRVVEMLGQIRGRISSLKRTPLGDSQRKAVEDAQTFLEQSQSALDANDLTRALNLARKASLLVNSTGP